MSKIRVLPEVLANKIAAGEVVERPASIAKELVENSLDAGARRVEVEIASAGRSLVRVADDGEGMSRDDAILAFERHATSKLRSVEDLSAISTFGFRGEALPSIAAVSKLTVTTRAASDVVGTQLTILGGKLGDVRDVAWPGGTELAVRDLFYNIPARRKFLKSDSTESYHVANLVTHYALANPGVAFTLLNNGRETIRVSAVGSLRERAYQLLGPALVDRLVEVEAESNGVRVRGYVSNPQEQRTSREAQYLFVNGRYVRDRLLGRAIADGFRSMMPSGTYPAAVLFVELAPERVDVNVHPAKIEVRFREEQVVRQVVGSAIRDALERATRPVVAFPAPETRAAAQPRPREVFIGSAREAESAAGPAAAFAPPAGEAPFARDEAPSGAPPAVAPPRDEAQLAPPAFPAERHRQPHLDLSFRPTAPLPAEPTHAAPAPGPAAEPPAPSPAPRADDTAPADIFERYEAAAAEAPASHRGMPVVSGAALPDRSGELSGQIRPLGQIRDSFIVATDDEGLLLVDQHVAHERILFERFRDAHRSAAPARQHLLLPETIDLTPAQAVAFERLLPELEAAGFDVLTLSGRTIAISAVPAELPPTDVRALLTEILDAVDSAEGRGSLDAVREEIAASLACRAAIKINMPLGDEKMRWLIDELLRSQNPWTCPHGRPILLRFTIRDIERQFQRPEGYRKA